MNCHGLIHINPDLCLLLSGFGMIGLQLKEIWSLSFVDQRRLGWLIKYQIIRVGFLEDRPADYIWNHLLYLRQKNS